MLPTCKQYFQSIILNTADSENLKRLTPFKGRKSLAESLVLSRLNYSNLVFGWLQSTLKTVYNVYKRIQLAMSSVDTPDLWTSYT